MTARTPSQTIGPFFGFALPWEGGPVLVPQGTPDAIHITGRLTDGAGNPVPDGLIEIWQADEAGRLPDPEAAGTDDAGASFRGFGRSATDAGGRFEFWTVKPGPVDPVEGVPGAIDRPQAPHIDVSVFARGLLTRLVTRIYFEDEPDANAADPILALVPDPRSHDTLIARKTADGYEFDIRLQGDGETVFFDF